MKMQLRPAQGYTFVSRSEVNGREIVGAVVGMEDDGRVVFAQCIVRDPTQMKDHLGDLTEHIAKFIDDTKPPSQA